MNEAKEKDAKVSYVDFYIREIASEVDIKQDYYNWFTASQKVCMYMYIILSTADIIST